MLAGSAVGDLFKNTLSRIPTVFGRLAYLGSLRDPTSGVYNHHGLSTLFGRDESRRALSEGHRQVFQEWLNLPLSEKREDLDDFLKSAGEERNTFLKFWMKSGAPANSLPASAFEAEKELFVKEFAILVETFRCD